MRLCCVIIRGQVQGVGYRAWTQRTALGHDLEGWVRNRRDGSVEAVVSGRPEAVKQIIEWARRGPRGAAVTQVDVFAGEGAFDGFELWPTA